MIFTPPSKWRFLNETYVLATDGFLGGAAKAADADPLGDGPLPRATLAVLLIMVGLMIDAGEMLLALTATDAVLYLSAPCSLLPSSSDSLATSLVSAFSAAAIPLITDCEWRRCSPCSRIGWTVAELYLDLSVHFSRCRYSANPLALILILFGPRRYVDIVHASTPPNDDLVKRYVSS